MFKDSSQPHQAFVAPTIIAQTDLTARLLICFFSFFARCVGLYKKLFVRVILLLFLALATQGGTTEASKKAPYFHLPSWLPSLGRVPRVQWVT